MQVTFLGQGLTSGLDRAIGDELRAAISDGSFNSLTAFVAFVSSSAAEFLGDQISLRNGFNAVLNVGIDQKGTSKEALEALLRFPVNTKLFFTTSNPIYHPKVYIFSGPALVRVIIGSSNLTTTGLFANVESSIRIDFSKGDADGDTLLKDISDFFSPITAAGANVQHLTQALIDTLLAHGIVPTEADRAAAQGETKSAATAGTAPIPIQKLFPSRKSAPMPVPRRKHAAVPLVNVVTPTPSLMPKPSPAVVPQLLTKRRFWIETGNMTGGSRNQLDLSTVTRLGQIFGSLSLFGLERLKRGETKSIRFRYKGEDYDNNPILFKKGNGTWRLEMNGIAPSGKSLTVYCKDNFIGKILIFTEIGPDHYEITPVSTSDELSRLQKESKVWDQNRGSRGRRGRFFGEL